MLPPNWSGYRSSLLKMFRVPLWRRNTGDQAAAAFCAVASSILGHAEALSFYFQVSVLEKILDSWGFSDARRAQVPVWAWSAFFKNVSSRLPLAGNSLSADIDCFGLVAKFSSLCSCLISTILLLSTGVASSSFRISDNLLRAPPAVLSSNGSQCALCPYLHAD